MWQTLRKFGLGHCDLPTMVWNISVMLRMLCLNVDSRYTRRIPIVFYMVTAAIAASYCYTYQFSMLWFLFVRSPQTGDLVAAMVVLSLGVSSEIAIMKLMFMFTTVKKIKRMVNEYLECDALTVPGTRFSKNLSKVLKRVKMRALFFWTMIMVNSIAYVITPAFQSGRHLAEDLYVIYGLEPMLESPNYEIATLLSGASVCFICFATANITVFIMIIAGYTEAQMLALSKEIVNVWDDAIQEYYANTIELKFETLICLYQNDKLDFDEDAKKKINIEVKKILISIIQNHARNIRLLRQIEDVFRLSIAIGFVFLIISLIAELLGGLENTFLQVPFTLSQVVMDCWTGQRVMDASMVFERAVYDCKWENFDQNNMRIVLLMLQCSQRTLTLSAGGMTMLSFSCLMSILKSVYSTYTTLRSMIKKPE